MTNEELFFQFVKGHDDLAHIEYGDKPFEGQQWIGVIDPEEIYTNEDELVIDPNWDEIWDNYAASSGFGDVEAMTALLDAADTDKKVANFVTKWILTPMKDSNVQADKVYVVINKNFTKTWFDSIIEV